MARISPGKFQKVTLDVVVDDAITIDSLSDILRRTVDLAGCTGCGLAGFDIHFRNLATQPAELWTVDSPIINEVGGLGGEGIQELNVAASNSFSAG